MSVKSLPKPLRKLLRHWSEVAYERELGIELESIYNEFNRWKAGLVQRRGSSPSSLI